MERFRQIVLGAVGCRDRNWEFTCRPDWCAILRLENRVSTSFLSQCYR